MLDDTTTTVTTATLHGTGEVTSNYVQVDWNTYQPIQNCYPYQPWAGWYPSFPINPWVGIPYYPPVTTQQIFVPRALSDAEIEAIADRVAEKMIAAKKGKH